MYYQLVDTRDQTVVSRHLDIAAVVEADLLLQRAHKRRTRAHIPTACVMTSGVAVDDIRVRAVANGAVYQDLEGRETIGDLFEALYRHFGEELFAPRDVLARIEKDPQGDLAQALRAKGTDIFPTLYETLRSARGNVRGRLKLAGFGAWPGFRMKLM